MRKRSEVAPAITGSTAAPLPGQQPMFVQCKCGLKQSTAAAKEGCIRCGEPVLMEPVAAKQIDQLEPKHEPAQPMESRLSIETPGPKNDPWKLEPGSVRPGVTGPASGPAVGGGITGIEQPMGGDVVFSEVAAKLFAKINVHVPLHDIATWTPEQRKKAFDWASDPQSHIPPRFLAPFVRAKTTEEKLHDISVAKTEAKKDLPKVTTAVTNIVNASSLGDKVIYVWGMETICPVPGSYSAVHIGPFTAETTRQPGESYMGAYDRLASEVVVMAEQERDRKVKSFLAKWKQTVAEAKS